jgi:thymidine phosphorylase
MKDRERALELAQTMVALGERAGVRTVAQLTNMDQPLGVAIGNGLEVTESVDVLLGRGPADVTELTLALARDMVALCGLEVDPAQKLADGSAYRVYRDMIAAQGGDPDAEMPVAAQREVIEAPRAGYVTSVDAFAVGIAAWRLGAGRARKEDPVSAAAGGAGPHPRR